MKLNRNADIKQSVKISVIIPCFNQGQYLDEAVDSVANQTFKDFEIIVVDDGSTDEFTIAKLRKYNKPKCKVIHTTNQGLAAARNNGIKISEGKYILPIDADDKIGPRYLEEAVKILDREEKIGIVYCYAEYFGEKTGLWDLPDYSLNRILIMNMIFCCAMFRKKDFDRTNGFNPNMIYGWEDWDFWLSLIEMGKEVFRLPEVHFYYRVTSHNSMIDELKQNPDKKEYSLKTIYLNHIDFYIQKTGNPIELYEKLNNILKSKNYKIAKLILIPYHRLKKLLKGRF